MKMLLNTMSLLLCLAATTMAFAAGEQDYTDKIGERVTTFDNAALNYRLDIAGEAYTYVNFSEQIPDASFAAIRFNPNAFSVVIVEDGAAVSTSEQYAELVQVAMVERLAAREDAKYKGHSDIGATSDRGMQVFQKAFYAEVDKKPVTYIVSSIVDGQRAYQLLTFAANTSEDVVKAEAGKLLAGFSIRDTAANETLAPKPQSIDDFPSTTFGYRFRARSPGWFDWTDLNDTNAGADVGVLSAKGYGAVVMPVCWNGAAPSHNAIYRVMMQQFGEDYPSDFISDESDVKKDDATGKLLIGIEAVDGEEFLYHQWVVVGESCAYTLAGWGSRKRGTTKRDLNRLWKDFRITGNATATAGQYQNEHEKEVNAYTLNALGMHYYEARSFRDAHRFFANANELSPGDEAYLTNALRSLSEIEAYAEAKDWLQPRLGPFAENQVVQSWVAWLAYQTNDPDTAIAIYRELFANEYREDDDFSAYATMLADAELWEELDSAYAGYTAGGVNESTKRLHAQLLSRRGRYEQALAVLDEMTVGRPFNADLAYERLSILDDMGNPAELLRVAESLIENGYRSLQSYYYKGDAEYQLRSFRKARESFETALTFSPGNSNVREYLDAIDRTLGKGDVSSISTAISAVGLPKDLQKIFESDDVPEQQGGYGAEYLSRITGYDFGGGDTLTETQYRKIHVLDDNGIAQFSTLEFDFDPSYEQLFVNTLVVRDADGTVLAEGSLDTYYITSDEDGYEASTEKTVHMPVPSLAPGVVIEAVVSKLTAVEKGSFPLETIYLAGDRPIGYSAVFVSGKAQQVRYEGNAIAEPVRRGKALVWEIQQPVAYRWEPLQPQVDQFLPWVQLGTVGEDWPTVGADYFAKIADKLAVDKVAERAARLVDGIDSEARQIAILSAYVQNEIHYEAIEFGRRAYIPKAARDTVRDRYGDCKDHAVLLYTMLESVGIDASLALVSLQQKVLPELPNTDQFDHMIVAVPTENGPVFIDTTDKDLRLGQLPPRSMAGNHALLLGEKPDLVRIPDYEAGLTGLNIERTVEPGPDGRINVTEVARFTGYQAAEMRGQLRSIETSAMRTALQRWVAGRYSDAEVTNHFVENVFDAGYDLIVEIEYNLPLEADGAFDVPSFIESYYLEYDRVADRRFPFEFAYPFQLSATTSVKIPSGRRLDVASKKPSVGESMFGNWRREVSQSDDSWEIRFDYAASDERFDATEYRDFAEFQRDAVDAVEQALVLQ